MASLHYGYSNFLKDVTDDHETRVDSLETDNTAEKAKVSTLQGEMTTVQAEVVALEGAINKSDSNDDTVKSTLLSIVSYLEAFSEGYTIYDSEDVEVSAPDWSAMTTALNALEDHEIV